MNSCTRRRCIIATVAVTALLFCTYFFDVGARLSDFFSTTAILAGNTPAVVSEAQVVGHVDGQKHVRIVIGLKLRNEDELDKLLKEQVATPGSAYYHRYLTPEEFNARFAPSADDVDKTVAFLTKSGLQVKAVALNRRLIEAEGTAAQLEAAFDLSLNQYSWQPTGQPGAAQLFESNNRDPRIPSELKSVVESVSGLNTLAQVHSRLKHPSGNATPHNSPVGLTPSDVASVYSFPNANNRRATDKYTGAGRVIAIATAYGYDPKDVAAYWKQFGITRTGTVTNISVNGTTKKTIDETTLDLEQAGAQAPGADILMYISSGTGTDDFSVVFNRIVTDNRADAISVSWGSCEPLTSPADIKTDDNILKQAHAQGMAVFSSSGDDGAYDCHLKRYKTKLALDTPSSDPYVTAVGGTTAIAWGGKRVWEEAWSGSGGGVSIIWAKPFWQVGPGIPAGPNDKMRLTADVALNADPDTGYASYYQGQWLLIAGTSLATPNWAALWVLCDQAAGMRLGSVNETLYRIGNSPDYGTVFYDVTKGNNGDGKGPGYKAGPGWDNPTGLGVPNGTALENWLFKDSLKNPPGPFAPVTLPQTPDSGAGGAQKPLAKPANPLN